MRHFGKAKKTAKATDEVLKSQIYQAIKSVSKTVKVVKGLLVLKCTKKITSLKESKDENTISSSEKLNNELQWLETLKEIDQQIFAAAIVRAKVLFGSDPRYNLTDKALDSSIDADVLQAVINHKKVVDILAEIQTKITATVEKNNELRAKEQSKATKTTAAKSLFSKKDGYVDGSKAVFMESLNSDNNSAEKKVVSNKDLIKLNKSLRNQANRLANRSKSAGGEPEPVDAPYTKRARAFDDAESGSSKRQKRDDGDPSMMMYRPLDQRFPGSNSSSSTAGKSDGTNSSAGRSNSANSNNSARRPERSGRDAGRSAPPARGGRSASASASSSAPARPAAVAADLTKAASFGKEWQKTGVHPSWAAKQHAKQQTVGTIPPVATGSAAGLGKKIVFDD